MTVVRAATDGDLDAMARVDPVAAEVDSERRRSLRRAVEAGECLVADDDGSLAGFMVLRRGHFFDRDFIELVIVDSSRRRAGVGRQLVRAAVAVATSAEVFSSTNRSNAPMLALFDSERWLFSGELCGLDADDPELVFFTRR